MYTPTKSDIAHEGVYLAHGLKVIGNGKDSHHRLFQFIDCLHEQDARISAVKIGNFRCQTCLDDKLAKEANENGLELLEIFRNGTQTFGKYIFTECGHHQDIRCGDVRKGKDFKCQQCFQEKIHSEASAVGLELIETFRRAKATYGRYKFIECGHTHEIACTAVRSGEFKCRTCGQTWANRPSNLYLHRIEHGTTTLLKFGRARNVERRAVQYGLAVGSELKILEVWPISTGIEADRIEALVAKQFTGYNKTKAKLVLQDSGWTECYNIDDQQAIIDFVGQQVIQSTYTSSQIGLH